MASLLEGQLVNTSQQMGLASIPRDVNYYVGAGPVVIEDPKETDPNENASRYLVLSIEKGSFRIKSGSHPAMPAYAIPTVTVTDNSGSLPLEEFEIYVFTAPDAFTVVGNNGNAILTYAWINGE